MTPAYWLVQKFWLGLDWLFPPLCAGCGRAGFRWCPDCQHQVRLVSEPLCQSCGRPLSHPGLCRDCKNSPPPFDALRSWAVFEGPVRNAIHSLKYRRNLALGDALAGYLAVYLKNLGWIPDVVVPVPLGRQRMQERGYNQAALLALPLAYLQGWSYSPKGVARIRDTRSQVGLTEQQRQENIANAFVADPVRVSGKVVLLVDDVSTTGSTLRACSDALRKAGALKIYALTLAKALPHHGLQIV